MFSSPTQKKNNRFSTDFIFASEEYPEYLNRYYDVMGIYIDNQQIAFDPTGAPITINGPFFASNQVLIPPASGSPYDGSTPILTARANVAPGDHTLVIAICDINDRQYDSAGFFTIGGCTGNCTGPVTVNVCYNKGGGM